MGKKYEIATASNSDSKNIPQEIAAKYLFTKSVEKKKNRCMISVEKFMRTPEEKIWILSNFSNVIVEFILSSSGKKNKK